MKNMKKFVVLIAATGVLALAGVAYAADIKIPADGQFKAQMLEQKKDILDQRVKDGILTQQQADDIYNGIKAKQADCDSTGKAGIGKKFGAGFGQGKGMRNGAGCGMGSGTGMGNGSCVGN